jgi:MFS family permease
MNDNAANRRWLMLALCFATRVGLGFQFQTLGSVADPLAREMHFSFSEIGSLIGLYMVPGLVLSLPAGVAGRWASDKVLIAGGLLALALGGAADAMAHGFGLFAIGRLLCGAGFVFSTIFFTKMVADWFAGREIATAMAIVVMSWPFGIAMGQVVHGWLAATEHWRLAFVIASLYCLAGALLVLLFYRPPPAAAAATAPTSTRLTGREWTLILIAAFVWAAFNAAYLVWASFAADVLTARGPGRAGTSSIEAASIVSVASWLLIFSGALAGQIADRTGRAGLVLVVCQLVAIVCLVLLPRPGWALPASIAFGLVGMAPAGLIMALTGQAMAPHKRAFGMGVFFSAWFLMTAPAPAIAGWLRDRTGDPYAPMIFAIAAIVLTIASYGVFRWAAIALKPSR